MLRHFALFLLLSLTVTVCRAQEIGVIVDSTVFKCNYKISFLGHTAEYGEHISYYAPVKDSAGAVPDTIEWLSSLSGDMGRFTGDSLLPYPPIEVVVQSCDGKKKYEIEKTRLDYFVVNNNTVTPITYLSEGALIDLKKSFELHNEYERMSISLKGVPDYIYLYILIGIDAKK